MTNRHPRGTNAPDDDRESEGDEALLAYLKAQDAGGHAGSPSNPSPPIPDDFARDDLRISALFAAEDTAGAAGGGPALPMPCDFGEYELREMLGSGGMGVVYRAWHRRLEREVALKMVRAGRFASEADLRRFRNEARTAAHLDHPNLVPVYDVGTVEGQQYYTMKLVEGVGFDSLLAHMPTRPRCLASVVAVAARAVHFAHQHGVLHRDLKPSNVLIASDGTPYVTDFGLAKRFEGQDDLTAADCVAGTPSYMAPEQAAGVRDLTTATDVYGLGAILYQGLTGHRPFETASPARLFQDVLERTPTLPRWLNPKIDRDLEAICLKCLEKEPHRRYQSAAALADDIDRWLGGRPILARHPTIADHVLKWARRKPQAAAALAGLLLAVVIAVVALAHLWRQAEAARAEAVTARDEAEAARADLEWNLYVSRLTLADRETLAGDPGRAEQALTACPPDLRGWEWHLLLRRCQGIAPLQSSADHGAIIDLCWRPGGELAVSRTDGTIDILERNGQVRPAAGFRLSQVGLDALTFLPHSDRFVVSFSDGRVATRELAGRTLRTLRRANPDHRARHLAASPDGRLAAALFEVNRPGGAVTRVVVWVVESGRVLFEWDDDSPPARIAFAPDGSALAVATKPDRLTFLDPADGRVTRRFRVPGVRVGAFGFSPDGATLLATSGSSLTLMAGCLASTFEVATGRMTHSRLIHRGEVREVAFHPSGVRYVTCAEDRTVRVWDARTHAELLALRCTNDSINMARFSPDGHRLAVLDGSQAVTVWDGRPGAESDRDPRERWVHVPNVKPASAVAVSGDGRLVAVAGPGLIRVWDCEARRAVDVPNAEETALRMALDRAGHRLAVSELDSRLRVWDLRGPKLLAKAGPFAGPGGEFTRGLSLTADGAALAQSNGWQTRVLAADGGDRIADWSGPTYEFRAAALSPDGRLVAGADTLHVVRVRSETGRVILALTGHTGEVRAIAFDPAGHRLATGGADQTVRVWNLDTGDCSAVLTGHTDAVADVHFGPDGTRIASAGLDRTVRVWDAASGRETHVFRCRRAAALKVNFRESSGELLTVGITDAGDPIVTCWALDGPPAGAASAKR